MQGGDERLEKTIRVYFADNTYKTLPLNLDTSVNDVLEWLCRRLSAGGRHIEPSCCDLFTISLGHQSLRERRLQREDKPLQIQAKGGTAFKFLFRETLQQPGVEQPVAPGDDGGSPTTEQSPAADTQDRQAGNGTVLEEEALGGTSNAGGTAPESTDAGAGVSSVAMGPTAEGLLKNGMLERLLEDGSWYPCTVILDEDRLWYSQATGSEKDGVGKYGGGMVCLLLRECDGVAEAEEKKLLQLNTKGGTMTFRARSSTEKTAWLLAVVKQAAFVKERDILLQAEKIIAGTEYRRASQQVRNLDSFSNLSAALASKEVRELIQNFALSEWEETHTHQGSLEAFIEMDAPQATEAMMRTPMDFQTEEMLRSPSLSTRPAGGSLGGSPCRVASTMRWPKGLIVKTVAECLERRAAGETPAPGIEEDDRRAWAFIEETLFPRFLEHPGVQYRLCWIAAGIT